MKPRHSLSILVMALSLAGCASAPTHYYTLIATTTSAQIQDSDTPFQFEMLPLRMPLQVDQPPVVVRQGDGALAILENDRWGAPLGDEFHDSLTGQLERRFGSRDLAGLPKQVEKPVLSVRVDVRRFESVLDQHALIDVVWNLSLSLSLSPKGDKRRSLTCSSVIRQAAGPGIENVVLAHQRAIALLADTIAETAQAWALPMPDKSSNSAIPEPRCQ